MHHPKLSNATFTPRYDRRALRIGHVHLGLGAFFRAHGAAYTDSVLANGDARWGIVGVSLQRPDQRDRLKPQDCLYTMIERDGADSRARIIGSVVDVLVAPENPAAVIALMAAPETKIVSLTITEKGYCHDPSTGRLAAGHADVRYDLEHADRPRTAVGFLMAALAMRRANGLAPPTIICCDNLPHNGRLLAGLVRDFAALRDDTLSQWIERNGAFPSTMVDRIVPAVTDDVVNAAASLTGLKDAAPVAHEPFAQWVIENTFVDGARPAWHEVGAEIVADVAPYEAMKLQMLNGAHSALAYLGYLGGHETIADCMGDPAYRGFIRRLWEDETIQVTAAPPGVDLMRYADSLAARFSNTAIRHRTLQIAMDGSQKLPQRLLKPIAARIAQGLPIERLALAVAGWMRYVGGIDERGRAIDVRDPLSARFAAIARDVSNSEVRVAALLAIEEIFPRSLVATATFVSAVTSAHNELIHSGARAAAAQSARLTTTSDSQ